MSWSSCASPCVPTSPDLIVLAVLLAEMVKADSLLMGNPHWKLCHSVGTGKNLRKGTDQPAFCFLLRDGIYLLVIPNRWDLYSQRPGLLSKSIICWLGCNSSVFSCSSSASPREERILLSGSVPKESTSRVCHHSGCPPTAVPLGLSSTCKGCVKHEWWLLMLVLVLCPLQKVGNNEQWGSLKSSVIMKKT